MRPESKKVQGRGGRERDPCHLPEAVKDFAYDSAPAKVDGAFGEAVTAPAAVTVGVRVGVPHHEATVQDVLEVRRIVLRREEACLISERHKIRMYADAA